ncbi:Pyruvate dehydrogenase E1 component [Pandoraea aquatica]|uniref:Pyruvate dehydrogenase E1 component n=1 Tax=Pandoraea aquatica TaxID=2508290 RepID=A0A5E4V5N4_9BURK|nr:pyruvate dehydrogenase [Pandoraea aquatica]VVE06709.1 Pyruvate dehydrogenase E1 component [Pandoraea aquatica]
MRGWRSGGRAAVNAPDEVTRQAALACIGKLRAVRSAGKLPVSPSGALASLTNALSEGETSDKVWIVDADAEIVPAVSRDPDAKRKRSSKPVPLASAIVTWFRSAPARERPLLYLLHSPTLRGVLSAGIEAAGLRDAEDAGAARRGIFLNDATIWSPDRFKRVRPELPMWLAAQAEWLPYDPASAQELKALLCAALDALYVRGESGFCYMSAHEVPLAHSRALTHGDARNAFKGMYRLRALPDTNPPYVVRLCGAGRALANVLEAARWLQLDWGVACEVWSCPSYTRLAREAGEAERVAMLHPDQAPDLPHLVECLGGRSAPVLAVTGYARHIANQIGAFVPARFAALGSDDFLESDIGAATDDSGERLGTGDAPGVRWIVLNALRLLVDEGTLPRTRIADATRRYGVV